MTYRIISSESGKELVISEEKMEWLHNSLRLMQEEQQRLAKERDGQKLKASEIGEGSATPEAEMDVGEMFQEQFQVVTDLREELVELVGYDMTDDS